MIRIFLIRKLRGPSSSSRSILQQLAIAGSAADVNLPGWRLHRLSTDHWSIRVNGNWRVTFDFIGEHAVLVDYQDYH